MRYDPIKNRLIGFFNKSHTSRQLLYAMLDLLLLRAWHIHYELKRWAADMVPSANNNPSQGKLVPRHDSPAHILDAGTGFGQHAYYLSTLSARWSIFAVDKKREHVCDCNTFFHNRGNNNIFCKTQNLLELDQTEAFDLVLSVDVLTHIENDYLVMRNFHTALKPQGMLLLCTPTLRTGKVSFKRSDESETERVRMGYDKQELRAKLTEAGFSKITMRYIYGRPGALSWRLSVKLPVHLLNASNIFFALLPIYYLLVFPFCYVLNWLDMKRNHKTGMGLVVKAWK